VLLCSTEKRLAYKAALNLALQMCTLPLVWSPLPSSLLQVFHPAIGSLLLLQRCCPRFACILGCVLGLRGLGCGSRQLRHRHTARLERSLNVCSLHIQLVDQIFGFRDIVRRGLDALCIQTVAAVAVAANACSVL
jgi:hypothetical protein